MQQRDRIFTRDIISRNFAEVVGVRCGICGAVTEKSFTTIHHGHIAFQNVPCVKCKQCGEVFLDNHTAEIIDDILDSKSVKERCIYEN